MYNLLIGGAAGDGVETTAGLLEKILLRSGYHVFSTRDFMSRVRGGHNFATIRFAQDAVKAHRDTLDGLVAMNAETVELHKHSLSPEGFILCDKSLGIQDSRVIPIDLYDLAKKSGNPKTIGTICIGALLKLFGIGIDTVDLTMEQTLKPKILEANKTAVRLGYGDVDEMFRSQPGDLSGNMLVTGSDAISLGALAGGVQFYSAYPMSPSSEILAFLSRKGEEFRVAVEQAEDEIAAINMALGASYAGARAMTGTSGGGFSLMVEALGFAGIAELPVVIANMQRPGPATGFPTRTEQSDLLFAINASHGEFPRMVIALRDHADAFYQTARALRIAEDYQIPVILLGDQYLADSATTIPLLDVSAAWVPSRIDPAVENPAEYKRYELHHTGVSPMLTPGKTLAQVRVDSDEHDERGVITESAEQRVKQMNKRMAKLDSLRDELLEPEYVGMEEPEVLLLGFGSTAGAIKEAVATMVDASSQKLGALLFGDVFPLPKKMLEKYAINAKKIINIEQNATGQLARLISCETQITCDGSILKYDGRQLSVDDIIYELGSLLA